MSDLKIRDNASYSESCDMIREEGRKRFGERGYERIVFTNGCFDVLHAGHLHLLNECRRLAGPRGTVVVGVNSDDSVKRLKGETRPINKEYDRCILLIHLKSVDHVVVFEDDTPRNLIEELGPDLIVKGSDYLGTHVVGSNVAPVHFVNILEGLSTTSWIEKVRDGK